MRTTTVLALLCACSNGVIAREEKLSGQSTWSMLVYMAAEDDWIAHRLAGLQALGGNDGIEVAIQVSRPVEGQFVTLDGAYRELPMAKVTRLRLDGHELVTEEELGTVDAGDGSTYENFLRWGFAAHPADHVIVLNVSHGMGRKGFSGSRASKIGLLSLADLTQAFARADRPHKVDLVAFDSCMMASMELAVGLAPYADAMLATADVVPVTAESDWDLSAFGIVRREPGIQGTALAKHLAPIFAAPYAPSMSVSAIDLAAMSNVTEALSAFGTAILDHTDRTALHAAISTRGYELEPLLAAWEGLSPTVAEAGARAREAIEQSREVSGGAESQKLGFVSPPFPNHQIAAMSMSDDIRYGGEVSDMSIPLMVDWLTKVATISERVAEMTRPIFESTNIERDGALFRARLSSSSILGEPRVRLTDARGSIEGTIKDGVAVADASGSKRCVLILGEQRVPVACNGAPDAVAYMLHRDRPSAAAQSATVELANGRVKAIWAQTVAEPFEEDTLEPMAWQPCESHEGFCLYGTGIEVSVNALSIEIGDWLPSEDAVMSVVNDGLRGDVIGLR